MAYEKQKKYNNLFDSICMTILFFVCLVFYLVILWFGVINSNEGNNPITLLIISTIVFGVMMAITIFLIIKFCYEYWIILDDSIIYKKLFFKKRKIKLSEIERVEKKIVPALVLGVYKSNAYIIYSNCNKITILINEKKRYLELDSILIKYVNQ